MCTDQIEIKLNIYDLHPHNKYYHWLGLGAYHAGVEFLGKEWSFGYCDNGGTGVYSAPPRTAQGVTFRDSLTIGFCSYIRSQINSILLRFEREFPGTSYNILTNNCITFCDKLCFSLTQQHIPSWVGRLSTVASQLSCMLPKSLGTLSPLITSSTDQYHIQNNNHFSSRFESNDSINNDNSNNNNNFSVCCCECECECGGIAMIDESNCSSENESFDDNEYDDSSDVDSYSRQDEMTFEIYNLLPFTVRKNKHF